MIHIPTPDLRSLIDYKDQLEKLIQKLSSSKKSSLSVSKRDGGTYYAIKYEGSSKQYVGKKDVSALKMILQNHYNYKLLVRATNELNILKRFLHRINIQNIEVLYSELTEDMKRYIKPYAVSNEDYSKAWQAKAFKTHPEAPDDIFITSRNEKVRSKSEVIIADTLNTMGVPYKYERELVLGDGKIFYPDFTILNVRTREEIIYEHFGKMDDEAYSSRTLAKLNTYAKNGFTLGKNLIATFENSTCALNRTTLIRTIENVLN